jgi:hypothetical protein
MHDGADDSGVAHAGQWEEALRFFYCAPLFDPIEADVLEIDFVHGTATIEYEVAPGTLINVFRDEGQPPIKRMRRVVPNTMITSVPVDPDGRGP